MADKFLFLTIVMATLTIVSACPKKCTCSGGHVQCYGVGLMDVPSDIPANTTHLDLQNNQIEKINPQNFKHMQNLQELLLGYNHITEIAAGTFSELANLEILNLDSNQLTSLEPGVFQGLSNLSSLYVTNNKIVNIDGAFKNVSKLVRVDLGGNKINDVTGSTFADLKELIYLMMPDNNLEKLSSDSFASMQSLSYLVLKNNPIKNADNLLKRNHRLAYIDLTGCGLKDVPSGLPWATRYLQLRNNNITRVKKTAFLGTRSLSIIVLDENQITRIERGAFARIRNLQEIWLNDNKLKKIPSPFSSKVTKLHMSKNRISKFSKKDFPINSAITTISLNSNQIGNISANTFSNVGFLEELYLNGNKMTTLVTDTFKGLGEMKTLSLNNNKLASIQGGAFNGLTSLNKLDMAFVVDIDTIIEGNPFASTPNLTVLDLQLSSSIAKQILKSDEILASLGNLTMINLMNNNLNTINPNFRAYLPKIKQIKMVGNRWHCDKRLQWLSAWLKADSKVFFMARSVDCNTPASLKGLPLSILRPSQFAEVTTTIAPSTTTVTTKSPSTSTASTEMSTMAATTKKMKRRPAKPKSKPKSKPKRKRPSTERPATKTIVFTKTKIVTMTQRFFVFPSTSPVPDSKTTQKPVDHTKITPKKTVSMEMVETTESTPASTSTSSAKVTSSSKVKSTSDKYTQQITSGMLTGKPSTPTTDTTVVTEIPEGKFSNSTAESSNLDKTNSSDTETSPQATMSQTSGVDMTTVIIATCVAAAVLLIIIVIVIFFAVRYRQNKLVYHRALQYQQDYTDVVFFVGEPIQDFEPKPRVSRTRSDRGSTSSRPSEDITNDLDTSMKVYTWDDE